MTAEQILSEIGKIRWMLPGSITRQKRKNRRDQPVTYFIYNYYGPGTKKTDRTPRTHTRYVLAADVPAMEEMIAEGKRFDELVARYKKLIYGQTRRERHFSMRPRTKNKGASPVATAPAGE